MNIIVLGYQLTRKAVDWRILFLLWYFVIPCLIFLLFWYRWVLGVPAIMVSVILILFYKVKWQTIDISKEILLALISLLLVILSGNGELNFQTYDHFKHNLIFADLTKYDWPVYYSSESEHLNYYLGYYLIPSLFGKIFGVQWVATANLFILSFGIYLCLSYLSKIYNWKFFHLVFFFFYSASAFLIVLLRSILDDDASIRTVFDNMYMIWEGSWGRFPQSLLYDSFRFVPQHFLAALSFVAFWKESKDLNTPIVVVFLSFAIFTSAYIFLAGILFMVLKKSFSMKLIKTNVVPVILSLIPVLLIGIYYLSHVSGGRNVGNFTYNNVDSYLYLTFSVLSFSLPLVLFSYLISKKLKKKIVRGAAFYLLGSFLLAFTGDFDFFARGTLIFQIPFLIMGLDDLNDSIFMRRLNIWGSLMVVISLVLPGFISMLGPSLYWFKIKRSWPSPKFSIEGAYKEYDSIKDLYCAIKDNSESKMSYMCGKKEAEEKYLGKDCLLLKK